MQLTLADTEVEALRSAVKYRLDTLVASLNDTDTNSFKTVVRGEIDTLEAVYGRLGCSHETGTAAAKCDYIAKPDTPQEWMGDSD